jgi:hypothetical protein
MKKKKSKFVSEFKQNDRESVVTESVFINSQITHQRNAPYSNFLFFNPYTCNV